MSFDAIQDVFIRNPLGTFDAALFHLLLECGPPERVAIQNPPLRQTRGGRLPSQEIGSNADSNTSNGVEDR